MSKELTSRIEPKEYEDKIYQFWLDNKLFHADEKSKKPPYSIVIPPPNVTGSLHMGHALDETIQDILARYHRLKGFEVLWLPGTDHAGIATQNVVEKELAKQGLKKEDIGREEFIKKVWEWKERSGNSIINQLKKLGSSCDWDRLRFTMDEGLSRAVREVFVSLYNEGLIYRSNYMVNWCVRCHTAISDLEVDFAEEDGNLYYIKYKLSDDNSKYVTVATTRPETFFADTAVAINPNDPRHKHLIGKNVMLPITDKIIPIILDDFVDMEFGTGVVKITPAHDSNDFAIGKKYNLDMPQCIDNKGFIITGTAEGFDGLDRFAARKKIIEKLTELNLIEKIEPHKHNVGKCYRCGTTIEPMISMQWFLKVTDMANAASGAVKNGETNIVPKTWENTYFEWMDNIRDWCISRQIWWGHRIPAWHCNTCGEIIVSKDDITKCDKCGSTDLRPETDVLDTWFSSSLWPFSTFGYPDKTETLAKFYPTSCLVTGFDILFFWVARMMMMGIKFMGVPPFKDIYLHALLRDEHGNKMSKSRGNVIDPLVITDQYGTDAFRFTLAIFSAQGRDIKINVNRIEGYRNFINKIWNASRFIFMNLGDKKPAEIDYDKLLNEDKWILMHLQTSANKVAKSMSEYAFNDAANEIYSFFWFKFCDYYLELIKERLYSDDEKIKSTALNVAAFVLEKSLIILHPFIPFVTEHIFQILTGKKTIMYDTFPDNLDYKYDESAQLIDEAIEATNIIRNIRGEYNISPAKEIEIYFTATDKNKNNLITECSAIISKLAKVSKIITDTEVKSESVSGIGNGYQINIITSDLIDKKAELARLTKELTTLEKDFNLYGGKLKNENYLKKASADIIEKDKIKFADVTNKIESINTAISKLKS